MNLRLNEPGLEKLNHGGGTPSVAALAAADRGLWKEPSAEALWGLRRTYLEMEGHLEGQ